MCFRKSDLTIGCHQEHLASFVFQLQILQLVNKTTYYLNVFTDYCRNSLGHVFMKYLRKMLWIAKNQYGVTKASVRGHKTSAFECQIFYSNSLIPQAYATCDYYWNKKEKILFQSNIMYMRILTFLSTHVSAAWYYIVTLCHTCSCVPTDSNKNRNNVEQPQNCSLTTTSS